MSKEFAPEILKSVEASFNKIYDKAIDHAIGIVQSHIGKLPSPSPNHFNNELDKIVGELEQLKNKKEQV